jgi:polysaccharide biosynthesis protein PslH
LLYAIITAASSRTIQQNQHANSYGTPESRYAQGDFDDNIGLRLGVVTQVREEDDPYGTIMPLTIEIYLNERLFMRQLTILSPVVPYPPRSGGTAHIVQITRQLARYYHVALYALAADPAAVTWGPLTEWCDDVRAFGRTPQSDWGIAPPAVRQEYSAALVAYLRHTWAKQPPEIVQLEFTSMAQYAPLAHQAGAQVVCTAHNVAFLAQIRRAQLQRGLVLRARRWAGALSLWLYELRALRRCDLVITHSAEDAAALRRWLPRRPITYVPSGIDLADWPVCFDPRAKDEVLFVGNYLHPPNVEGALWLAREVWPLVRQQRPGARLTLAGRAPPSTIQSLAAPDIRVPGDLDDLRPLYARSSLVAAPIFWGTGVRIKLLEALACGMPVVTTALAAEGIDLHQGTSALFAEQPAEFAAAIARLLDDSALRARLGAAGHLIVARDYDSEQIGARLARLYAGMLQ